MIRIDFHEPLSALEIREPALAVCRRVASEFDLHVKFDQRQQAALTGHSGLPKSKRQRIGNGKHKDWFIDYQVEEPQVNRPTIVGRLAIKGPFYPEDMQYGGFDYGEYGGDPPTYNHITVHTPSELGHHMPIDPTPDILSMTYEGLKDCFETSYPRLFDVVPFSRESSYVGAF